MNEPDVLADMLGHPPTTPRSLAVLGLSDDPARPSHSVSAYMQRHGYRILPVNPVLAGKTVLGEPVYGSLAELPFKPSVVNVFRLPKYIPAIVEEMIQLGFRDLWVQLGIRNPEAAARAESAGLRVVMDRCILIEHKRFRLGERPPTI
ncbi:MAG: CoA-binding protein [Micavibrio sp.]|nr:CoA-binding protein [Micavibrio sp.]